MKMLENSGRIENKYRGKTGFAKKDFAQVRSLVENSFMHNWAISIEYAVKHNGNNVTWVRWGKTAYAIKDAQPILEKIEECCRKNADCSMKMICEHFNPEYRFIYCLSQQLE